MGRNILYFFGKIETMFTVANASTGEIIASRVTQARGWKMRFFGLLGRSEPRPDEGLWFDNSWGVHTFFLSFPLDMLFLDKEFRVVALEHAVPPNQSSVAYATAAHVIQFRSGTLAKCDLLAGDKVKVTPF
jgi:uncharacterized protein